MDNRDQMREGYDVLGVEGEEQGDEEDGEEEEGQKVNWVVW